MASRSRIRVWIARTAYLIQAAGAATAIAQGGGGTRDLVDPIEAPGEPQPFHIEFPDAGVAPTPFGQAQLDQVVAALQGPAWKDRPVLVAVCGREDARRRAEWVRSFLVERGAVDESALFTAVFEPGATSSGECVAQPDDPHWSERHVAVRPWDRQQMADLAGSLSPAPVRAQVSFWHRARGASSFEPLQDGDAVISGDEFQVYVSVEQPAHAYVFHRGSGGSWACLWPGRLGRNPLDPGRQYWLPDPDRGFALDQTAGREETFVYLGATPHPRLETWAREGVPWTVVRGLDEAAASDEVRVTSPARHMNWYRWISFEHRPGRD